MKYTLWQNELNLINLYFMFVLLSFLTSSVIRKAQCHILILKLLDLTVRFNSINIVKLGSNGLDISA
jgi:hypothetical protein